MTAPVHIGIDTSNYTTSAAAVTPAGEVFCSQRLLPVAAGARGLRQSEALFYHVKAVGGMIADVMEKARAALGECRVESVGVSDRPRRAEGSYMPCFLAGLSAAESIAAATGARLFTFSHQEGHVEAARFGAAREGRAFCEKAFYALHLSGGTTELIFCTEDGARYETSIAATALDVTIGQLVDRCGVRLNLAFPAGKELEKLAEKAEKRFSVTVPRKPDGINLSGFENRFEALQSKGETKENLAGFVFDAAEAAIRALLTFCEDTEKPVLFGGGVSSSHLLRERLAEKRFYFAPPETCTDNAIGIALLARKEAAYGR